MNDREHSVSATMIKLADTLAPDYDLTALLGTLIEQYAKLLDVSDVGIVIADERGVLHAMASTTQQVRVLEVLELQRGEGPSVDCILSSAPVEARLLDDTSRTQWPTFSTAAVDAGFRQVIALPMRLRDSTIGAVKVLFVDPREVPAADLQLARALADIATIGILHERTARESAVVAEQLQGALNSRIAIEQAKGMLAEHHNISVDEAFSLLRDYVRSHNFRLADIARSIANHQFALDQFSTVRHGSDHRTFSGGNRSLRAASRDVQASRQVQVPRSGTRST